MKQYFFRVVSQISLWLCISFLFLLPPLNLYGQSGGLPLKELSLDNLEEFQDPSENWMIAGDVFMDLYTRHDVHPEPGTGVLVNTSGGDSPQDIFTVWEHGDLDLELEFMMAGESNSGIYLQGRYEIQMLDSWGVKTPKFYDMGGVYEWWEDGEGTGGIAPLANASRAPGLWQHLEIRFRAPRFNENGEKTEHARLEEVKLNGVVIHRNVNLVHPTGGAVSNEEVEKGPLRFQGDHGPVAFRNIRYKTYQPEKPDLTNISYQLFEGDFESASDIEDSEPVRSGSLDHLNLNMLRSSGEFAVSYQGQISIPEPGEYYFDTRSDGGHLLKINGQGISETDDSARRGHSNEATISLEQGTHSFSLIYFRGPRGGQPAIGVFSEGPQIRMHGLHQPRALPVGQQNIPYLAEPVGQPKVMHGFMDMGGRVHTHTAATGFPGGVNFALDQNNGSILKIWKGDFLNLSTMWIGRGGGNLSLNEENAISFDGSPPAASLNHDNDAWPDSLQQDVDYRFQHYRFEEDGSLSFSYQLDRVQVTDHLAPCEQGTTLNRVLTFHSDDDQRDRFYYRIASGENISWLSNRLFQVDDKTYYIKLNAENRRSAWIRNSDGGQELIIPIPARQKTILEYSYVW
jgi:hypothetical protein